MVQHSMFQEPLLRDQCLLKKLSLVGYQKVSYSWLSVSVSCGFINISVFCWRQELVNSHQSVGTKCIFPGYDLCGRSSHTRFRIYGPCCIIHGKQECRSAGELDMGWKWSVLTKLSSNQLPLSLSEAYLFMIPLKFASSEAAALL